MGSRVENCQGLGDESRGYLLFDDELYVGANKDEEHIDILISSGREIAEVLVAGGLLVSGNRIVVDGDGSTSLAIEKRDPVLVAEFIEAFPDASGKRIMPRQ